MAVSVILDKHKKELGLSPMPISYKLMKKSTGCIPDVNVRHIRQTQIVLGVSPMPIYIKLDKQNEY